jgi:hypothetical protein
MCVLLVLDHIWLRLTTIKFYIFTSRSIEQANFYSYFFYYYFFIIFFEQANWNDIYVRMCMFECGGSTTQRMHFIRLAGPHSLSIRQKCCRSWSIWFQQATGGLSCKGTRPFGTVCGYASELKRRLVLKPMNQHVTHFRWYWIDTACWFGLSGNTPLCMYFV